jgi:hypothetical protein
MKPFWRESYINFNTVMNSESYGYSGKIPLDEWANSSFSSQDRVFLHFSINLQFYKALGSAET